MTLLGGLEISPRRRQRVNALYEQEQERLAAQSGRVAYDDTRVLMAMKWTLNRATPIVEVLSWYMRIEARGLVLKGFDELTINKVHPMNLCYSL